MNPLFLRQLKRMLLISIIETIIFCGESKLLPVVVVEVTSPDCHSHLCKTRSMGLIFKLSEEPASYPTLTKAPYIYDYGDVANMTPLMAIYSHRHNIITAHIHAGGFLYHGMLLLVSASLRDGLMEATAIHQSECSEAGLLFLRNKDKNL